MSRKLVASKLMPGTIDVLDAMADRLNRSRASALEILINTFGPKVDRTTPIPAGALPAGGRSPGQKRGKKTSKNLSKKTWH